MQRVEEGDPPQAVDVDGPVHGPVHEPVVGNDPANPIADQGIQPEPADAHNALPPGPRFTLAIDGPEPGVPLDTNLIAALAGLRFHLTIDGAEQGCRHDAHPGGVEPDAGDQRPQAGDELASGALPPSERPLNFDH